MIYPEDRTEEEINQEIDILKDKAAVIARKLVDRAIGDMALVSSDDTKKPDYACMVMMETLASACCWTYAAFAGRHDVPEEELQEKILKHFHNDLLGGYKVGIQKRKEDQDAK